MNPTKNLDICDKTKGTAGEYEISKHQHNYLPMSRTECNHCCDWSSEESYPAENGFHYCDLLKMSQLRGLFVDDIVFHDAWHYGVVNLSDEL